MFSDRSPMNLLAENLKYNWHPYTQMSLLGEHQPLLIERAEGLKLFDSEGRWYYDTISSWWCNVHGHGHPKLREAVSRQMAELDHVLFGAVTHKPAIELSRRLVELAPPGISRVFYSDNGSTAVEVALKMSVQYWRNSGQPQKSAFISLDRGYHGDTVGCMSVSGVDLFRQAFAPLLFDSYQAPTPYCYRCPIGEQGRKMGTGTDYSRPQAVKRIICTCPHFPIEKDKGKYITCPCICLQGLEDILIEHGERIAGIILEPLLLGAGGMLVYPPAYLAGAAELARKYGVHLILDEVATGFGRTGTFFACEGGLSSPTAEAPVYFPGARASREHGRAGVPASLATGDGRPPIISPDFLCIAKGLTGGLLPMAATLTTEEIYGAFLGENGSGKTFYHGHTFTANPIGCALALAGLDIFEETDLLQHVQEIAPVLQAEMQQFAAHPLVGDVRGIGMVAALELVRDKESKEPLPPGDPLLKQICQLGLQNGILLRPIGNVIYLFLPQCTTREELADILDRLRVTLEQII